MTIGVATTAISREDKAMKKTSLKKLPLHRETLLALIPKQLELAHGGTVPSNFTHCICTLGDDCVTGLCVSDACPTALCA